MPSIQQLEFARQLAGKSQATLILERLRETPKQWVNMMELHQVSGSMNVHSRIAELRAGGHVIDNRIETVAGVKKHSFFRWLGWESKSL